MTGSPARLFLGVAVAAILMSGCSPAVHVPAPPPVQASSTSQPGPVDSAAAMAGDASPTTGATLAPPPTPTQVAEPQPFAFNLYEDGDFVPQYTFEWCVAASIQMAHNLVRKGGDGTWAGQAQQGELWEMARVRSSNAFNGANPMGWAAVLGEVGLGRYRVVSIPGYADALRTAARAMANTGRPVGLVMWSGRHAWVMSGFESVGDPLLHPEFQVTGIRVLDPLYPYGSGQWGPSPAPGTLLNPEQLATQFVVREPRRWSSGLPTGYMLVVPEQAGS
ncbi:hypothetical protein ACIPWF_23335 [Paenarthrobacter sp. NPDC089989]|uniref:hypothetical protein n=1 Tax=unclassified Paenarthrobacter TaxID=2634190 RepID=UPI003805ECEF